MGQRSKLNEQAYTMDAGKEKEGKAIQSKQNQSKNCELGRSRRVA